MAETAASTGKKRDGRYRGNYQGNGQPNANSGTTTEQGGQQTGGYTFGGGYGGRNSYNNINVPITNDLMGQAELYYQSAYEAQRNAAQQTHDESQLLLDQQLSEMVKQYDQQREQSRENYAQAYAQADRQSLSRGMQRSSYNNATLGNISIAGNEAQQAISDTQARQANNLNEQKTLYGRQLQQTLESLTKQQQSDVLAKVDALKREQEQLNIQKEQLNLQQQQMQMEYDMWLQEFNQKYGNKGGGGSGGSSSSSRSSSSTKKTPTNQDKNASTLLGELGVGGNTVVTSDHGIAASNTITGPLKEYMDKLNASKK